MREYGSDFEVYAIAHELRAVDEIPCNWTLLPRSVLVVELTIPRILLEELGLGDSHGADLERDVLAIAEAHFDLAEDLVWNHQDDEESLQLADALTHAIEELLTQER